MLYSSDQPLTQDELALVQERARSLPGATGAPAVVSQDGTAATVFIPVTTKDAVETAAVVTDLRTAAKADLPEGLTAQVTGPAAIQADLAAVFDGANFRLLAATASVVAILLVITYRSPVLWLIPLTVVGLADQLAAVLATHTLAAFDVLWDESTIGILSVLVFGAGTDYALLLISRYRDQLRVTPDRREAMAIALTRTAEAVLSSATTVVLGLLTLLLSLFPATRGLGLACAVGVVVAAAFALVVLPAALVVFGRWVFWPKVPHVGETGLADGHSFWGRVGNAVARRPAGFVTVTVILLGVMAGGITQIQTGLDQADQFLSKPEAIAAGERLAQSFPAGAADPAYVMTRSDGEAVAATVRTVEGVSAVRVGRQRERRHRGRRRDRRAARLGCRLRHRRLHSATPWPERRTPTWAAPRPWPWTPPTPIAATSVILPVILLLVLVVLGRCSCGRWSRRCCSRHGRGDLPRQPGPVVGDLHPVLGFDRLDDGSRCSPSCSSWPSASTTTSSS